MKLTLAHIGTRSAGRYEFESLTAGYLDRCSAFAQCTAQAFPTAAALLEWLDRQKGRTTAFLTLFDSSGRQLSSGAFAKWLSERRDGGEQHLVFAIGPHSGWSDAARGRAGLLLSLGAWTLPHAMARLVVAEQIYRAFTILSGHPYHCGH
jgi:23S rRNA (pseudouridine1915-N3)-methyltransferase